jgi:hypothetical protein
LNIGPFVVDSDGDPAAARETLTQLEQLRWVLGNLLESKDLPSLWPIRILLTKQAPASTDFVWENSEYVYVQAPGAKPPLDKVAGILLDANTPRLPAEVESGIRQLFGTLEAHGSHVTWGSSPKEPDLGWARLHLFATKAEYSGRFHIFVTTVAESTTIRVAETNAFGKDSAEIEKEAAADLASHNWQTVPVSGRPLDPRRDFGQHSLEGTIADVYLAGLQPDRKAAEAADKAAIEGGKRGAAVGYEGLAVLAKATNQDPMPYLQQAIDAGSLSANVFLMAAESGMPADAVPMLKKAALLNPRWAEPVLRQAELSSDPARKEELLKQAAKLDPRSAKIWQELAQTQLANNHFTAAQGSWLQAENAAATSAEREGIHQKRLDFEEKRLDLAEEQRKQEREAAHRDDQRAQDAETARIRAAEEKANQAIDTEAGGSRPTKVEAWWDDKSGRHMEGTLKQVDCLAGTKRLWFMSLDGKLLALSAQQGDDLARLGCGVLKPAARVAVTYSPHPDKNTGTAGEVIRLEMK